MSFGYGIGDVIAVLGLFERIAIELRNYKDAPTHFQQLRAELDLVHSTLKHVLTMEPDCMEELQTLEKIRAIVVHCSQPLQTMANKMRSKESSLGHFRSTKSLSSIGERLHWSMISQGDVDALRKTILSQMAAINILLSVQQLARVKQLSLQSKGIGDNQSAIIEKHANVIGGHASNILNIVSKTQASVNTLTVNAAIQADAQSKQYNLIEQSMTGIEKSMFQLTRKTEKVSAVVRRHAEFVTRHVKILYSLMKDVKDLFVFLAKCSREMLEAIGRNTQVSREQLGMRMLLDISGQLKKIIKAIEAIPLHLTLDIVRLDDAHGESWALPFQACQTWDINELSWEGMITSGLHIEQAMLVKRAGPQETCVDPTCTGNLVEHILQHDYRKSCINCGRWIMTSPDSSPLLALYRKDSTAATGKDSEFSCGNETKVGPQAPLMTVKDQTETFRRLKVVYSTEPVRDIRDAFERVTDNPKNPEANAFLGLVMIQKAHKPTTDDQEARKLTIKAILHLRTAVESDSGNAEYYYLMGRAYMLLDVAEMARLCFRYALVFQPDCAFFWHSFGLLSFATRQYEDNVTLLTKTLSLDSHIYVAWYNLGVLFDSQGRYDTGTDAFQTCYYLVPWWPGVRERLEAYHAYVQDSNEKLFRQHLLHHMIDTRIPFQPQCERGNPSPEQGTGVQGFKDNVEGNNAL
ncbi:hypothetical protein FPOAC1_000219 [Fusarium poae]|uniref:hypothetical protein n=1 Tax=Fusarium poae TaxID=36050 RepID=UPI001CEB8766|nr:hypothetical protein FPOAC1_000219 [Fusarium poae]KAG8674255.1 hypothetical protein FPOAC1_000219 [Fusarium poae]